MMETEPVCDLCDEPMACVRGDDCYLHAGDWNGETGNHLSCEWAKTNSLTEGE